LNDDDPPRGTAGGGYPHGLNCTAIPWRMGRGTVVREL
jgi:hypothetical protein